MLLIVKLIKLNRVSWAIVYFYMWLLNIYKQLQQLFCFRLSFMLSITLQKCKLYIKNFADIEYYSLFVETNLIYMF